MRIIDTNIITMNGKVSDDELVADIKRRALSEAGFLDDDGKPLKGVTINVNRYGGRAGSGGYAVRIMRDMSQAVQPRLEAPKEGRP